MTPISGEDSSMSKGIGCVMGPELRAKVEAESRRTGVKMSAFVRVVAERHFAGTSPDVPLPQHPNGRAKPNQFVIPRDIRGRVAAETLRGGASASWIVRRALWERLAGRPFDPRARDEVRAMVDEEFRRSGISESQLVRMALDAYLKPKEAQQ